MIKNSPIIITRHGEKFTPEEAQYAIDNLK
ncbi:Ltp family lipoprotein [Anoxybacillus flavithermus]